jgi:hypothetical protein
MFLKSESLYILNVIYALSGAIYVFKNYVYIFHKIMFNEVHVHMLAELCHIQIVI